MFLFLKIGSPFQFTVGPLQDGGAHRVHAGGPGLERGIQGQPSDFNVWTREAGHGSLAIAVEGPSKAEVEFKATVRVYNLEAGPKDHTERLATASKMRKLIEDTYGVIHLEFCWIL